METTKDQICCPKFDPIPWEDKNFEWNDKIFVRGSIYTFFYIPCNYSSVMKNGTPTQGASLPINRDRSALGQVMLPLRGVTP